jgi:hydroxymethylglutaryl-CoA reductase
MKEGFSKLNKSEKIDWVINNFFNSSKSDSELLKKYWSNDDELQKIHDEFSENTISNFFLPLGIAPNFIIDKNNYTIPMATEESSVVAAACKSAKFWAKRGGFKTEIIDLIKTGQVHFKYDGAKEKIFKFFKQIKKMLISDCTEINKNMKKRGGGILDIELIDKTNDIENYYQISSRFNTVDSMGANFINSCLEQYAKTFETEFLNSKLFEKGEKLEIIMSILSNYVPECLVRAEVRCKVDELKNKDIQDPKIFAQKFVDAIKIAKNDIGRAVTHNKGIMNGIDSVVIATGNDFRAVEACAHAYASKNGNYSSLSHARVQKDEFVFWMEIPLAVGTVGGITNLHPLVKWSLKLLKNPSASDLMRIIVVAGLAQNFAALRSLITSGIQLGHMKMHLINILNSLDADNSEKKTLVEYFKKHKVSFRKAEKALTKLRRNEL